MENKQNILDQFIKHELEKKPTPFLTSNVMAGIEHSRQRSNIVFNFAMATSVAAALLMGIFLGKNYTNNTASDAYSLNINDTHLENLHLYNTEE
jgi:hypothetical protein